MVQFWDSIPDHLREWALTQQIFFTASAPLTGAHINISPKGLPAATFAVFTPTRAAYIDATGSGSETIAHVYENGRVTVMFCSFGPSPRILRLFCRGEVVEWGDARFEGWLGRMGKGRVEGARAVVLLEVWKVQTSCGFGVPLLSTSPTPTPALHDRPTMAHWALQKTATNTLLDYQAANNARSLDGCPALRSAMRDRGETVGLVLWEARARRIGKQREAVLVGVVLGVLLVLGARVGLGVFGVV